MKSKAESEVRITIDIQGSMLNVIHGYFANSEHVNLYVFSPNLKNYIYTYNYAS